MSCPGLYPYVFSYFINSFPRTTKDSLYQFHIGYVIVLLVRRPQSKPFVLPHGLEPKSTPWKGVVLTFRRRERLILSNMSKNYCSTCCAPGWTRTNDPQFKRLVHLRNWATSALLFFGGEYGQRSHTLWFNRPTLYHLSFFPFLWIQSESNR